MVAKGWEGLGPFSAQNECIFVYCKWRTLRIMGFSKVAVLVRQFANLSVKIFVSCPCYHCFSF